MTATARMTTPLSSPSAHPLPRGAAVPTWIATPNGPLAAHLHLPYGGQCRGAAILLAPFGRAEVAMRPALRVLADLLARHGALAIRADWSGTVESAAHRDGHAVPPMARRLDDVAALTVYARNTLGVPDLTVVGAGTGATLAAVALGDPQGPWPDVAGHPPYRCVVLIDPHPVLDPWTRLPQARPAAAARSRILLVSRAQAPIDPAVDDYALRIGADRLDATDLDALGPDALGPDALDPDALGPDALDGVASEPTLSLETWGIIADWLAFPSRRAIPAPVPDPVRAAVTGAGVVAEYVDIDGLPGVYTAPAGDTPRHAVLLIPDEGEHRGGPGGDGWVRLARAAALDGVGTLRFDRSGAGEARPADALAAPDAPLISQRSVEDHVAAMDWLAARTGCRPSVAGHGAGAWVALVTAGRVPATRVVSVGQSAWSTDPEQADELGPWLFRHLPYAVILRLGRTRALPTPQPLIEAATSLGADVDLYGDARHAAAFGAARGEDALEHLRRRGAPVQRYTERTALDLRRPELLEVMVGRVLGRLLRDVPVDSASRVVPQASGRLERREAAAPQTGAHAARTTSPGAATTHTDIDRDWTLGDWSGRDWTGGAWAGGDWGGPAVGRKRGGPGYAPA